MPFSTSAFVELLRRSESIIAALGLSTLVFIIVWSQMISNVFPPGDDPGNWLKRVNAVAGKTYPLWDETLFTYPPFFFVVSYAISLILVDRLTALKLVAALVFSAIPFTAFLFAKKVTKSSAVGLASAWIVAFFPGQFEMLWWGAYPNLFALAIMPTALLMLLLAQKGGLRHILSAILIGALLLMTHHLTSLVYLSTVTIASLASVAMRDKRAIKANFSVLVVMASIFAGIWYASLSAYVTRNPLISKPGFLTLDSLLFIFKNSTILFLSLASILMSLVQLFLSKRLREIVLALAWLSSGLLLTQLHLLGFIIDYKRFLFMTSIPLAILASVPFLNLKNCLKISKISGENPVYEIEIHAEKAFPVLIVLIVMLSTPFQGIIANQRAYAHYMWESRYGSEERLQALNWIRQNTNESATIVSDFHLGRWIEGYSERRALFPVPPESIFMRSEFKRYQVADTILSSNYQLANRYLKLDEWQPISSKFSPLVSVFRGNRYVGLVYLSDSFVRINLTRDEKSWIEAPYNAWLYQSRWLDRSREEARLQFSFRTMGLIIEKELNISADQPSAKIIYKVTSKRDVTLNTVSMNVYLVWGRTLFLHEVDGNEVRLFTDDGGVKLTFLGDLLRLEVGKDEDFNQDRVYAKFKAKPDMAEVAVAFEVLNPQQSWIDGVWAASSDELERDYGVTHITVPANFYDVERFSFSSVEGPVVYVDDCYARVEFVRAGNLWVEAPYRANVSSEETKNLNGVIVHATSYETMTLYINKTLVQGGSSGEIRYLVKAKEGASLQTFNLSVWLAWGRLISDAEVRDGKVLLVTDAGALEIEPAGKVLDLMYGLDEEFQMPRVLVVYSLNSDQGEASLTFRCLNEGSRVVTQLDATTRPIMEASDKTTIIIKAERYRQLFRNSEIVIYETSDRILAS